VSDWWYCFVYISAVLLAKITVQLLTEVLAKNWKYLWKNRGEVLEKVAPSACLSFCPSITLVDEDHIGWKFWKLIALLMSPTPSLFAAQRPFTHSQGNMGNFGETRGGVGKSGVLEHKSGNIS